MDNKPKTKKQFEDWLASKAFDVEHSLSIYAYNYCTIPAKFIYDKDILEPVKSVLKTCHIYLIGYTPTIYLIGATLNSTKLELTYKVAGIEYSVTIDVPDNLSLVDDGEIVFLEDGAGDRFWPDNLFIQSRLSVETNAVYFNVKYIGQAYGKDGSRNAIDRLLKHETLQKISLKGAPEGNELSLLLLSIQANNQTLTVLNPFAKNINEGTSRIKAGVDKLFNTTEQERITLYEASLIKYFAPEFNKEFKDSFPSTNMKVLKDCYEKDFSGVLAEIYIDELPFKLCSEAVDPKAYHLAAHCLHKSEDRRMFFGI